MSKIYIRFLRQGLVKTTTPENFNTMTSKEKIDWASEKLYQMTDLDIIAAMADFDDAEKTGEYFDEAPQAAAIEEAEGENIGRIIVETREWSLFASGEGMDIISRDLLNFMEDNPAALVDMTPVEEGGRWVVNANDEKGNTLESFYFESRKEAEETLCNLWKRSSREIEKRMLFSKGGICQKCRKLGENTCPGKAPGCFEKSA
ncbi:MAG: hypothetical protein HZB80_01970 [Deltaproteobacteria bacterium]|nr:hypothetical protein [Deltaproteobacteria bacterium]